MMRKQAWNLLVFLIGCVLTTVLYTLTLPEKAMSAPVKQFSPPTEITLTMYALNRDGSINWLDYSDPLCSATGATAYARGCTFYNNTYPVESQKVYPFGDAYTITIGYETHTEAGDPDAELGYLHNVVSQEMAEGSPVPAYAAQAVAARTYAYRQTQGGQVALDNSSGYQVYIPYRREGLGEGLGDATKAQRQADVQQAVAETESLYMTYDDDPIKAHFGMDNCTYTQAGAFPYLVSVYDPISAKPEPCNNSAYGTGYGGMGSTGASRWGYGNTSAYGIGESWGVQWEHSEYILTHYYTAIHLHNAAGERLTPNYRWVPLSIDWHTPNNEVPTFYYGQTYSVAVEIQNTGVLTWIGSGQFALMARWEANEQKNSPQLADGESNLFLITHPVTPGGSISGALILRPPYPTQHGIYHLSFEMSRWVAPTPDDWVDFGDLEAGRPWPSYDIGAVTILKLPPAPVFLPLVSRAGGPAARSAPGTP